MHQNGAVRQDRHTLRQHFDAAQRETRQSQGRMVHFLTNLFNAVFGTKAALKMG
jgi:hypothetical protein